MPVPTGTSLLLGRERDVAELDEALALSAQGTPQIVLVGGDAGIGKTTLVADLTRRSAERGFTVATGHGLDIEAGISFAPVVEAVRVLLDGLDDLESRPSARRMLTLLDPETPRSLEAFHVLDDLAATVLEAATAGPVLVVLEDMHWADRSTQDAAAGLSRTARGRLLFVLTFRSDELHRRHPFRRTLAEISRTFAARRIDLDALGQPTTSRGSSLPGETAHPTRPWWVPDWPVRRQPPVRRGALAANQEGIPGHLSDLLLARIDALDEGPRALLRVASIDGTRLDTGTLADLAGLDQPPGRLPPRSLDANVLRQIGDSLEFRHGLLREATYDDLLPAERSRTHGRMAEILQAKVDSERDPGLSTLSRLAFHWDAAHDLPRTLAASVRAGLVAQRLGLAEARTQLERALSLWDRVRTPRPWLAVRRPRSSYSSGSRQATKVTTSAGTCWSARRWTWSGPTPTRCWPAACTPPWPPAPSIPRTRSVRRRRSGGRSSTPVTHPRGGSHVPWAPRRSSSIGTTTSARVLSPPNEPPTPRGLRGASNRGSTTAWSGLSPGYLGHIGEALAGLERAIVLAREAGLVGEALDTTMYLAVQYMEAGSWIVASPFSSPSRV